MSITALGPAARRQAQAQLNARARHQLDAMKVARRKPVRMPKAPSPGEERFAQHLAASNFAVAGGWSREARLIHGRKWSVDFVHWGYRLVVEIEGITREGGRHQRLKGFTEDCRKYNALALEGWTVLRFTPGQVKKGSAIETVERAVATITRRTEHERETRERYRKSDTIAAMREVRDAVRYGRPLPG